MTSTSNRQTRLIVILIIFVGAVSGYIYYSRFTSVDLDVLPLANDPKDTLSQFKGIEFDFDIFNSANIKQLKIFGEVPVKSDLTGKINPFNNF